MNIRLAMRVCILSVALMAGWHESLQADEPDRFLQPPYGDGPSEIAEALKNCSKDQTTANTCAWDRFMKTDADYRQAVAAVRGAIASASEKVMFDEADAAFVRFRNATCQFDLGDGGGSMGFSIIYGCRASYNRRRTSALLKYAYCQKTDDCERPNVLYDLENEEQK